MALSVAKPRKEIHHRSLEMHAYVRDDGLYDVEAHLVDRKPFAFGRLLSCEPVPAGQPLHDLWIRLTVDQDLVVRAIEASSDVTPYGICKGAESTLSVLVGEKLVRGWSSLVKQRLRGAAGCTHLMEMLIPLATTGLQGIRGLLAERHTTLDAAGFPVKIDSCYAFRRNREVVMQLWPQHYRPAGEGLK
jgi:hypothetical protein